MRAAMKRVSTGVAVGVLAVLAALNVGGCGGPVKEADRARFVAAQGATSLTVYPVYVREGEAHRHDAALADRIAAFWSENDLATVTRVAGEVPLATEWGMNQSRMYRDSMADFSTFVRSTQIDTEYAALAEVLGGSGGGIGGVHLYVVAADGTPAFGAGLNSHHREFQDVSPGNADEAVTALLARVRNDLRAAGKLD